MLNVIAINGSPNMEKGRTAMILSPFLEGLEAQGADIGLYYASRLKVKPCSCGKLHCWNTTPGECIYQDSMQTLYPKLRKANLLVIAIPIYIPLPGDLQNVINRLVALLEPEIRFEDGRTRAHFRDDVQIGKVVLVASGGWWEMENFDTLIRIAKELAAVAGIPFGGAIIRPHSQLMIKDGKMTPQGQAVVQAIHRAGVELVSLGEIRQQTLEEIRQPLVSREDYFNRC
jgi:multimeric flavodoxin WrbA